MNSIPRSSLRTAPRRIRLLAFASATFAFFGASPGMRAQAPIELTGSRLERSDPIPVQPVTVYSSSDIAAKGYETLGEYMQSLPVNSGTMNSETTTLSPITGAVTMNPRGLGWNRTLTLINGHRASPYALVDSTPGLPQFVFNYNSIPAAAVDHIEFLKDGASGIYGSDAIGGVFNVVLKRNYSGTSVEADFANTLKHDSLNRRFSAFTGLADQQWDISVGVGYESRHSARIQDFGTTTTNYSYFGPVKGRSLLQVQAYPANIGLLGPQAPAAGVSTSGYYVVNGGSPTANPTKAGFMYVGPSTTYVPDINRYDAAKDHEEYPRREVASAMASLTRHFAAGLLGYVNVSFNRSHADTGVYPLGISGSSILALPASNPYNPFGVAVTTYYYRTGDAVYHRLVDEKTVTSDAGLKGSVGNWHWHGAINYSRDTAARQVDQIRMEDLVTALNGTTRSTALNLFGPSDNPDYPAKLFTRSTDNDNRATVFGAELFASARLWQIPLENAGQVGVGTGYEFRREEMAGNVDPVAYLSSNVLRASSGHRETQAVNLELSLPIQRWLEFQLAARHEEYTDVGGRTVPKLAAMLRLPRTDFVNVVLRGSYSESFKVPDLALRRQAEWMGYWASLSDPLRPQDPPRRVNAIIGGNPSLRPEKSKNHYIGAVVESKTIKGLTVGVDYFDIRLKDVIYTTSSSAPLSPVFLLSPDTQARIPGNIVRDNSHETPGPILYLRASSANLGYQLYRGIDYSVKYSHPTDRFGTFAVGAEATQILRTGTANGRGGAFQDLTGRYAAPKWRESAVASWQTKNYGGSVVADVVGKYFNDYASPGWGENPYAIVHPMVWYRGWRGFTFTAGSNNVFDHRPPPNALSSFLYGFDDRAYGPGAMGRTVYIKVRKDI